MFCRTRARIILVGLLLGFFGLKSYGQDLKTYSVSFPEHSRATSPNGRYALINVDSDSEPYHTVFSKTVDSRRGACFSTMVEVSMFCGIPTANPSL